MQITATWGDEEVAVEVEAECRTLAALKALLQDALPEVDVGTVRLEVGGRELADDDAVCGLEAGSVVGLSVTAAVLAAATLREEGCEVDLKTFGHAAGKGDLPEEGSDGISAGGAADGQGTDGRDKLTLVVRGEITLEGVSPYLNFRKG